MAPGFDIPRNKQQESSRKATMAGQWTVVKPSRSDDVLDANRQLQIANQIRAQFESVAPKRPPKPSRSEPDATAAPALFHSATNTIPELHKLRSLQSHSSPLFSARVANMEEQDEFVETQYYKQLDSIDKQHHKTGSGFISVEMEETAHGYEIQLPIGNGARTCVSGCRSNPATNDWIPRPEYDQGFSS
ncbi:uncharacterized protein [Euphorbia lathyris]|uniref:uncharacterized protein n=1 Tax=Euphorbia lathyris TaxID=212925 RepID=UPI003313848D